VRGRAVVDLSLESSAQTPYGVDQGPLNKSTVQERQGLRGLAAPWRFLQV